MRSRGHLREEVHVSINSLSSASERDKKRKLPTIGRLQAKTFSFLKNIKFPTLDQKNLLLSTYPRWNKTANFVALRLRYKTRKLHRREIIVVNEVL